MPRVLRILLLVIVLGTVAAVAAAEVAMRRLPELRFECEGSATSVYVAGLGDDTPVVARGCMVGEPFTPSIRTVDGTFTIRVPERAAQAMSEAQASDPTERRAPFRGASSAGGRLVLYDLRYERVDVEPVWRIADALAPTRQIRPWEHGFDEDGVSSLELPQPRIIVRGPESRIEFDLGGIELDDSSDVHLIAQPAPPAGAGMLT